VQANATGRIQRFTLSQDVIDARARIERDYPNIRVWWDAENEEHCITQIDSWGCESLVFATKSFHENLIRARLEAARNDKSDPLDDIDAWNARVEEEQERRLSERIHEVGEKLAHAFAADGLTVRPRMAPLSVGMKKINKLQNFDL
jgi:hypothetical protein